MRRWIQYASTDVKHCCHTGLLTVQQAGLAGPARHQRAPNAGHQRRDQTQRLFNSEVREKALVPGADQRPSRRCQANEQSDSSNTFYDRIGSETTHGRGL